MGCVVTKFILISQVVVCKNKLISAVYYFAEITLNSKVAADGISIMILRLLNMPKMN